MTMRARISRGASPGDDAWGNPKPGEFSDLATEPCRAWSKMRKQVRDDGKEVVVEDLRAIVPAGTDVRRDDRITVTDRLNKTLLDGPMAVQTVTRRGAAGSRSGHLELMLTRHFQDAVA